MTTIKHRVTQLEDATNPGKCRTCHGTGIHGKPWEASGIVYLSSSAPCPQCGRVSTRQHAVADASLDAVAKMFQPRNRLTLIRNEVTT